MGSILYNVSNEEIWRFIQLNYYTSPETRVYNREEGEYPTTLWYCVKALSRVHDLWSDIHMLEARYHSLLFVGMLATIL